MGYLDYVGLQHLWGNLKEKFASKSHTHDDRYYTESEMDGMLNSKSNTNHTHDASTLINALGTGAAAPTDPDYVITQWVGGGTSNTTWVRRPMSSIWSYIKSKADGLYQSKGNYATITHIHDDRYYTETEINDKLSGKAESKTLSKVDLNTVKTPGFYSAGGGNGCTNVPVSDAFGLIVTHNASGEYYTQIFFLINKNTSYRRYCNGGTWTKWTEEKLTDTNTWRGIQDNLTSDSKTDSLSAAQGKALKTLVDSKANSSHTHTKAQITDFPASLKNPTALTIQTNGTTAATYDGSAAKTVNITKASIGLGNADNTADKDKTVASAAKLATARTVSGGTDVVMNFKYDGSGNSSASIGYYSCKVGQGNTNNYPFHRIGHSGEITGSYNDKSITLYLTQGYQGGGFGIVRITVRTNNSNGVSGAEARWLVRSGFGADQIQLGFYNVYGKTYCDIFLKTNGTYNGTTVRAIGSDARGNISRTFTLCDSIEADGTTASDAKTSKESYATIAAAGTAIHKQAYTNTIIASDNGTVSYANSATTASKIGTGTIGSSTKPVYISSGTPTACSYSLGNACSKSVRTLSKQGSSGWENATTDQGYVPDMAFIAYWNGAYSGSYSNLAYCNKGAFGTAATKNTGDFATATHSHSYAGSGSAGGSANSAVKLDSSAGSTT